MQIQLNTPTDVKTLLLNDKIKPATAIDLISIMMSLMRFKFTNTAHTKDEVANQIDLLQQLDKPLMFWQKTNQFKITDVCN